MVSLLQPVYNADLQDFTFRIPESIAKMDSRSLAFKSKVVRCEVRMTSLGKFFSNLWEGKLSIQQDFFKVDSKALKQEITTALKEYSDSLVIFAGTQVDNSFESALQDLILQALHRVQQIAGSYSNREMVRSETKVIEEMFYGFKNGQEELLKLLE